MLIKRMTAASFGLAIFLASAAVRADEGGKVDNPLYKGWASRAVGSAATYSVEGTGPDGTPVKLSVTSTLTEKTDDSVTIESTIEGHSHSRTIPAKVAADAVKSVGEDEDVKAMDKTFKCKKVEVSSEAEGDTNANNKVTMYLSDEVVGGRVKMSVKGPNGADATVTITASDAK